MTNIAQSVHTEASPAVLLDPQRCQFSSADGRRCRMPRSQAHPTLCAAHARNAQGLSLQPTEKEDAGELQPGQTPDYAEELAPRYGDFKSVTEVNLALGKVFTLLAQNRISRRNAVALGYIAQLLLQTLPVVKEELIAARGYQAWTETLESVFREDEDDEEHDGDEEGGEKKTQAPAEAQNQTQAEPEAPLGTPISALSSCIPETSVTAPGQPGSEAHNGLAVARVFEECAPAHSEGPEAFAVSNEANDAETPAEENPEQSPEPEEIAPPPPSKWAYIDAYGNRTVVYNVRTGLLSV